MMAVNWNSAEIMRRARAGAMVGVSRWIVDVEDRAVKLIMNPPKTGHIYRRRGVAHQASAPGEAPANDTGRLVNARRIDLFESDLRARLTFSTEYASYLEFGTRKMEPRPFARRALAESVETGRKMVEEEVSAALR